MRSWAHALVASLLGLVACDLSSDGTDAFGKLADGLEGAPGGVVVELDLSKGLTEEPAQMSFLSSSSASSLSEVSIALKEALDDRRTRGVYVSLGMASLSFAQAEELSRVLATAGEHQPVVCHAHAYSNSTLWFAAQGCDDVWLSPAGEVATVGIAAQTLYLKRLLDRFKVRTDFLHMGKYKSAIEGLTREGPTEAARESLLSVLGSLRETWIKGVSEAREGKRVAYAVEHGPWTPPQALEQGLIDHVGYASQARDAAKKSAKTDTVKTASGLSDRRDAAEELSALLRSLAGSSSKESRDAHIVVLPVAGAIAMDGGNGVFGSGGIAARPLTKTLRRLAKDKAVKAVVLRIDSPGGSALASDLLWHELMLLRDKKPLIVSLAGTAASGGYYMACAGHAIVSERTTVLGSIGVFGGKVVVGDTLDEFGVSAVTFAASSEEGAGARAAYLSPLTEWDEATRGQVRAQMANIYDLFLARVAEGRGLEVAEVHKVAQGRIWSGVQGKEHALVDELGGLWRAIELAREKAHLRDSVPVKVEKGPETLLELLQLGDDADEEAIGDAIARLRQLPPGPLSALAKPLMPHVASLAPLLGKERVLVAMPFALTIE